MKATVVLIAALTAGPVFAACEDAALPDRPAIPDGEVATYEEMQIARAEVAEYVDATEALIACVQPQPFLHNYLVDRIERVAGQFNEERALFLQRSEAVAVN